VNIGLSGIGLLLIAVLGLAGWGLARLMGWSPLFTVLGVLGLVILIGGLQVRRALARQRRLMREGRWPPDRPQGAA
jgi:CHASE2 domain-containing sensor protein